MPDVSVVIPTRNRAGLLAMTLRSVLRQQRVSLEVLIVDEASTDDTTDVIVRARDPRVRVLRHHSPWGVARARNHGWQNARGEWVAFVDDDDVWAPDKLASQLQAADTTGRAWAYVGAVTIDEQGRVLAGVPPPPPALLVALLPSYNAVPGGGSNVVLRRTLLDAVGCFDSRHYNTEDWDMWLRLAQHGPPAWVPRPLVGYRVHGQTASLKTEAILAGAALIERDHGVHVDYGVLHRWFAESSLRSGRRRQALRHLALAAASGQAPGVVGDLLAIARRRLNRSLGQTNPRRYGPAALDEWCSQAQGWISELVSAA